MNDRRNRPLVLTSAEAKRREKLMTAIPETIRFIEAKRDEGVLSASKYSEYTHILNVLYVLEAKFAENPRRHDASFEQFLTDDRLQLYFKKEASVAMLKGFLGQHLNLMKAEMKRLGLELPLALEMLHRNYNKVGCAVPQQPQQWFSVVFRM